jgi:acyl-coenzyme A thioesterase PaaI-like protein
MAVTDSDHPFDSATRLTGEQGRFQGQTSEHYANMVGPFGGVIAAVLLKAALIHPERQGAPLSLTVNFVAPVADGNFTIEAMPVRTNRSTQHWNLTLLQDGHAAATATAVFASRKTTWSSGELPFPSAPSPDDVRPVTLEGFPAWVGHYDYRVIRGGIPPFIIV